MQPLSGLINWEFMNEPLYRWALFLIAWTFLIAAWNSILKIVQGLA